MLLADRAFGEFRRVGFRSKVDNEHHLALVKGDVADVPDVLVRVHSECVTGDVFGSQRCDCGPQLRAGAAPDRGGGPRACCSTWHRRAAASACSTSCAPTSCRIAASTRSQANLELGFPADLRDYGIGAQILADLGLTTIRLLTNNPRKIVGLEGSRPARRRATVPIEVQPQEHNLRYLRVKRDKLGHVLHHQDLRLEDAPLPREPEPTPHPT